MTEKRFEVTSELPKGWVDIIDTDDDRTLCNIRIEYANNIIGLLNKLYEENEQLKNTNQELYDTLQETMSYKALKMGEVSILERENEQLKQQIKNLVEKQGRIKQWIDLNKGKKVNLDE